MSPSLSNICCRINILANEALYTTENTPSLQLIWHEHNILQCPKIITELRRVSFHTPMHSLASFSFSSLRERHESAGS